MTVDVVLLSSSVARPRLIGPPSYWLSLSISSNFNFFLPGLYSYSAKLHLQKLCCYGFLLLVEWQLLVSPNFREDKLLLLFINPQPSVPLLLIPRVLFLFPWPVFTSRSCFYTCCFATCYSVQPSRKLAANAARSAARPSFDRRRTLFLQKYNFQLYDIFSSKIKQSVLLWSKMVQQQFSISTSTSSLFSQAI